MSIFTVSGGLAVDIVRQGRYDYLPRLIESTGDIVEDDLVPYLLANGGWSGLLDHIRIRPVYFHFQKPLTVYQWASVATSILFLVHTIYFVVKSMGIYANNT